MQLTIRELSVTAIMSEVTDIDGSSSLAGMGLPTLRLSVMTSGSFDLTKSFVLAARMGLRFRPDEIEQQELRTVAVSQVLSEGRRSSEGSCESVLRTLVGLTRVRSGGARSQVCAFEMQMKSS